MRRLVIGPLIALAVELALPATPAEGQLFRLEAETLVHDGLERESLLTTSQAWSFVSRFASVAEGGG